MLSLKEIVARTQAAKAAGALPVFADAPPTVTTPAKEPVAVTVARMRPCGHLDPVELSRSCGGTTHRCNLYGDVTSRPGKCTAAQRSCGACDDHTALVTLRARSLPVVSPAPPFVAKPDDPACGVVIGSYGWPELIDLQCRVIRDTCGRVPILVSADKPADVPALAAICARHDDVFLWPNPERIGHVGGDLAAFWKGVVWGAARGLTAVAKLSQRFVATRPRWLQDGASDLLASGLPLATRRCRGRENYDLRTEACLLDVRRWHRPNVLTRIAPRKYWNDRPGGPPAESLLSGVLADLLGGVYWPWALFGEDRYAPAVDTVWHCSHTRADYDSLATRYGVTLPGDFHTQGWAAERNRGEFRYG